MDKETKGIDQDWTSSQFHLVKGGSTHLIFDVNNLSLLEVDPLTYEAFLRRLEGRKMEDVIDECNRLKKLYKILGKKDLMATKSKPDMPGGIQKSVLERLVLNISNDCNLRCKYCYASSGNYGEERTLMKEEVAIKTIDYFYNIYNEINSIQFFGGEPLLNIQVIEALCEYINKKYCANEIDKPPLYAIVTNGTLISPEIFQVLSKYDIKVTVSIDGPQLIHDHLRGEGTFEEIIRNIQYLKDNGIEVGIECTFTNYHLINDIDVTDLMEFFYEQLGLHVTHIPFVAAINDDTLQISTEALVKSYSEATRFALESLNNDNYKVDSYTLRLLRAIAFKKAIEVYCPAGVNTLSVSAKGDIYPCFMFTGNDEFLIGNVLENKTDSSKLFAVSNMLKKINKWSDPKCGTCWAKSLCFGCLGNDYIVSGSVVNKPNCDFIKKLIESFLLNFSKISEDTAALSRIISLSGPIEFENIKT